MTGAGGLSSSPQSVTEIRSTLFLYWEVIPAEGVCSRGHDASLGAFPYTQIKSDALDKIVVDFDSS